MSHEVKQNSQLYLYTINYQTEEENLCSMEMRQLFHTVPQQKYFFSDQYINPTRSPFIKQCISILCEAESLEDLVHLIVSRNISYDNFKVIFIATECKVAYEDERKIEHLVGWNINGEAAMRFPEIVLAVTKIEEQWILGTYEKNEALWLKHIKKPHSYSTSLSTRVSRAIVNIAVSTNLQCKVVDPCCGVGTVLIEALSMGIHISGYDINPAAVRNARKNLEYFGYDDIVAVSDISNLTGRFDAAIVDLPYNLFSRITLEQQVMILKSARKIANKMVLVTLENMDTYIQLAGFQIVDRCHVSKGKLQRHILVCT